PALDQVVGGGVHGGLLVLRGLSCPCGLLRMCAYCRPISPAGSVRSVTVLAGSCAGSTMRGVTDALSPLSTSRSSLAGAATYDVARVRAHFPQLRAGEGLGAAHFDGPGGTQTPDVVADAVRDTLLGPLANDDSVTHAERNAGRAVVAGRTAMADLLNADPRGIVFGRSMTQLTIDLARTLAQDWGPGDEVVVTRLDHDANVRPWTIAAERAGATVRWADFDPDTGELDVRQLE